MTTPLPPPRPRRRSLRARWTAALLGAALVPLALLAWVTFRIQREGLAATERDLEVSVLDRVGDALERDLDAAAEGTHRVGRLLTEGRVADDDTRLALAQETMARADALASVSVYAPDGALIDTIVRVGDAPGPTPPPRLPAEVVREPPERGAWLPAKVHAGGVALRYVEPVRRAGAVRAWVLGALAPGVLRDAVADVSQAQFGRGDRALLVDDRFRLLASGDARPAGTALAGADIFAGGVVPPGAFRRPFLLTASFRDGRGEAMIGSVRTLPERGWAVVVRRPEREAFGALARARRALAVAAALVAALAAAAGALLAARTTRPLAALAELTRAYAARRFDARSTVRTGDELEALGDAMTAMARDLAASEAEVARRARVEQDLARYLPAEVAQAVATGSQALALGGERRAVAVLFADVVAFTGFAEGAAPERVVAFLNELFTVLTEVVFRHGGIVDKFMGDCVMAVFGAPHDQPDHAARALAAAEDMHRFVEASAPAWRETYGVEVRLGIGVNAGEALVGNLGSETRMEYTAIGDVVNVAARLEALARPGQTLVTAAAARAAGAGFAFGPLGTHPLRGKREPVEILELVA